MRPTRFSLAVAAIALLVTLVMAAGIWESYYPDPAAAGLRARRDYYEKVLKKSGVSFKEGLYYEVMNGAKPETRP